MKLPRIVDTDIPDHWAERSMMVRSALDCFAPLAITIRTKPETIGFSPAFDYSNTVELQAKHSRPR